MRGFHTAALFAVVALALCAGGAADTNTPQARGTGASNIGTADSRLSLNITTAAERPQGSDSDELTRGRRPNWGGNKDKPDKQRPSPPKHEEPEWCDSDAVCDTDLECHEKYPCQKTHCKTSHKFKGKGWQKKGKCVCKGNMNDRPCKLGQSYIIDECTGPLGNCEQGVCIPVDRDEGCACAECGSLSAVNIACLNDKRCKCDGEGTCVPNYVPDDTLCAVSTDNTNFPGVCEIATCQSGTCTVVPTPNLGCFMDKLLPECDEAGRCSADGSCVGLPCTDPQQDLCKGEDGNPCVTVAGDAGICCEKLCYINVDNTAALPTSCPCTTEGTACFNGASAKGYCCSNGVCKPLEANCPTDKTFCETFGDVNAACNVAGRGCGKGPSGQQECNNICKLVNPSAACIVADNCSCSAVSTVAQCDCEGNCSPPTLGTKCCFCNTPET